MTNHLREVVADALLPCPVCIGKGSVDRQHDADGMLWVYVSCNKCGLRTRGKWCSSGNDCPLFYREVRDEWNTRATIPTQSAGVEERDYDMEDRGAAALYAHCRPDADVKWEDLNDYEADKFRDEAQAVIAAALRTKQPAASEGDGRDWRLKLRDELRNTSKQVDHATAMEGWEVAMCEISEIAGNSSDDRIIRRARRVQEWIEAHRPTPPRHPADEVAVDDSMVERAADAYEAAAESEGFGRVDGSERVTHLRFIRAAIDAALHPGAKP